MNFFRNVFLPVWKYFFLHFENIPQCQLSTKNSLLFFILFLLFFFYCIFKGRFCLFLKPVIFVSLLHHCFFKFILSLCLLFSMVTQKLIIIHTYQQKDSEGRSIKYKKYTKVCPELHTRSLTAAGFNLFFYSVHIWVIFQNDGQIDFCLFFFFFSLSLFYYPWLPQSEKYFLMLSCLFNVSGLWKERIMRCTQMQKKIQLLPVEACKWKQNWSAAQWKQYPVSVSQTFFRTKQNFSGWCSSGPYNTFWANSPADHSLAYLWLLLCLDQTFWENSLHQENQKLAFSFSAIFFALVAKLQDEKALRLLILVSEITWGAQQSPLIDALPGYLM